MVRELPGWKGGAFRELTPVRTSDSPLVEYQEVSWDTPHWNHRMDGIHGIFWEHLSLNLKLCRISKIQKKTQGWQEASQYKDAVVNHLFLLSVVIVAAVILLLLLLGGGGGVGLSSSGFRKQTPCATVYCDGPPSCNCSNSCYNREASRVHQGANCARPVYAIIMTGARKVVVWHLNRHSNWPESIASRKLNRWDLAPGWCLWMQPSRKGRWCQRVLRWMMRTTF